MNRDLVASVPGATILPDLAPLAQPLVETAVSDTVAGQGADLLLGLGAVEYLGGSAFNAARVAALLNSPDPQLKLAFFGIAGAVDGSYPHLDALRTWQIDSDGVQKNPQPPATCLAMIESAGRTLLTASGANAEIAHFLHTQSEQLALRIAACDLIHVTSYLDPEAPALVADVLKRARLHNSGLLVSLDPGSGWVMPGGAGFDALLAQTNVLHLNNEEFAHLGGTDAVASLFARLSPSGQLIVARNHLGVTLHEALADGTIAHQMLPETPLPDRVEDATGAGDTFCGAFLWHFLTRPDAPLDAAGRGFAMARAKVGINGPVSEALVRALENRGPH